MGIFLQDVKTWDCLVEINSLPNEKILDWSKLKAFANDKIKFD